MENASKALIIAGSTLMGVLILSLFSMFLKEISVWPETQDEQKEIEQLAAFNKEFEVYDKSMMYGVDVISCLNKAKSYNEKYVDTPIYQIDIKVTIKSVLTESIEVLAMQPNLGGAGYRESSVIVTNVKVRKNGSTIDLKDIFSIDPAKQLTDFDEDEDLKYKMSNENTSIQDGVQYSVNDNVIQTLLGHSSDLKQIKKNTENDNLVYDGTKKGWTTATWSTYLYSFKQKKFKCSGMTYDDNTGRIKEIVFNEI